MIRVGLTGNIGSGKSSVAQVFAAEGAVVVDADRLVHEMLARGGAAAAPVLERFPEVGDGAGGVDRLALAAIVFADPARRRDLEALVHPLVIETTEALAREARDGGAALFVVEASLLFEAARSGGPEPRSRFDALVVVTCDPETAVTRAVARRGGDAAAAESDVRARAAAQIPQEEKARLADFVVDNGGDPAETERQVRVVVSRLLRREPPERRRAAGSPPMRFSPDAIREARLENGLVVLVAPEPVVPSLAYFTTYRVGSRNERPGITGISHLFEHMMFNGARRYGPKKFDAAIESNGGYSNAYTTHDVTAYYEVLPSDKLDLVLELESDRMVDLELSEANLSSEREVVKEERRLRTDENPIGALYEHLYAAAYLAHPYRWPVIGWMPDLDAMTVPDITDYFRIHYHPANAVVSVSGALDADAALAKIEAALGRIPRGPTPPPVVRSEPAQRGERRITLRKEAQLPSTLIAFHACDARSSDLHATDILQAVLSDGDSSRLRRRLVLEEPLCVDIHVDFPWTLDPGLFIVGFTTRPDVEPRRAEAAVLDELARIAREPPSAAELRKAKNQLDADFHRRLKTNEGRADQLASAEVILGSWRELFEASARYESVTAEDVQRVATQMLGVDNMTVAHLDPLRPGEGAPASAEDAE